MPFGFCQLTIVSIASHICSDKEQLAEQQLLKQEHLKCSIYAKDKDECSVHFIRTEVLKNIVVSELNKLLECVKSN